MLPSRFSQEIDEKSSHPAVLQVVQIIPQLLNLGGEDIWFVLGILACRGCGQLFKVRQLRCKFLPYLAYRLSTPGRSRQFGHGRSPVQCEVCHL